MTGFGVGWRLRAAVTAALVLGTGVAAAATVVFESDLGQATDRWQLSSYANSVKFEPAEVAGQPALKLTRRQLGGDSAWSLKTEPFAVREGGYSVAIELCANVPRLERSGSCSNPQWGCYLAWLGEDGEEAYPAKTFSLATSSNGWTEVKFGGEVPKGVKRARLSIAVDSPKLGEGEFVAFRRVAVKLYPPPAWPQGFVSLRDDGMTLVGGQPFFPIGIFSVQPCRRNGNDLVKAIEDLKALGFNTIHTYGTRDPEKLRVMLDTVERLGMKTFVPAAPYHGQLDVERVMELRNRTSILAWYLDDDTSLHASPAQLIMRKLACLELDVSRLTCQADTPDAYGTRYSAYVHGADVYLPEIYPFHQLRPVGNEVARVGKHLASIRAANAYAHAPVKGVWPILQHFDGWNDWKRFPTLAELRASSFAALVHGARGYMLYCYGNDKVDCSPAEWKAKYPDWWAGRGCANFTVAEHWDEMCEVVRQLAPLAEDLASRDAAEQPKVTVVDGPRRDPCGMPAVSGLVKDTGLFLAVNSTTNAVTAEFVFARSGGERKFVKAFQPHEVLIKRLKGQ